MFFNLLKLVFLVTLAIQFIACTDDDSDSNPNDSLSEDYDDDFDFTRANTRCGVSVNGFVYNPIFLDEEAKFDLTATGGSTVEISLDGDNFTVKLLGINIKPGREIEAMSYINELGRTKVFYVEAQEGCEIKLESDTVFVGQIISGGGNSFSEALLNRGLANVDLGDPCAPRQILSCYQSINLS